MSFIQIEFFIFLSILYCALLLIKNMKARKLLIILGNVYFYAYWDYRFLLLISIPAVADFLFGRYIYATANLTVRRVFLAASLVIDLSLLGIFKYFNWFISGFGKITLSFDVGLASLDIIMPLGISFFIFRMISYVIDVYRGETEACESFTDFYLYATFFPIMVSGPISRASHFIPQLKEYSVCTADIYSAFRLFVIGLFIKVFVADNLAQFVNYYYANHNAFDTGTSWLAVFSYSLQIYCDFAGYSSMAIGISLLIGIRIEDNFNYPYLSRSIREFWRRWHITLSNWIRDYIYFPLGGSRKGEGRADFNTLAAMVVCGLWHGASLTFLIWGFLHGVLLSIYRSVSIATIRKISYYGYLKKFVDVIFTFVMVSLMWVVFRSDSFSQVMEIITKLITIRGGVAWYPPLVIFLLIGGIFVHLMKAMDYDSIELKTKKIYSLPVFFCLIWLVLAFHPKDFQPFIYAAF